MKVAHLLRQYRKIINPPYTGKDFAIIFATFFILISIPLTVILAQQGFNLKSLAAENRTLNPSLSLAATYKSISVYASFQSDDNQNNSASFQYRKVGDTSWKNGMEMTPDRRSTVTGGGNSFSNPYKNQWRASILMLDPNTSYEVKVTFTDSDGITGSNPVNQTVTTRNDNIPLGSGNTYYVLPTGTGTACVNGATFSTIQKAANCVGAGDTVYIRAGTYREEVIIMRSGTANNWITFMNYGSEKATIDGEGTRDTNIGFGDAISYVRIKGLDLQRAADMSIGVSPGSSNIVIEDSTIHDFGNGAVWVNDGSSNLTIQRNTFNTDLLYNVNHDGAVHALNFWRSQGGHVIRDNTFSLDGINGDAISGGSNFEINGSFHRDTDIYGNFIEGASDDAIEIEGAAMNVRVWGNTITGCQIAFGVAPIIIGPAYIFRNTIYDLKYYYTELVGWKVDEAGTGNLYIYHNTFYVPNQNGGRRSIAIGGWGSNESSTNIKALNNIFHVSSRVYDEMSANGGGRTGGTGPNKVDYNLIFNEDGVPNGGVEPLAKWDGQKPNTIEDFRSDFGQEINGRYSRANFVNAANKDFHLSVGSPGIDQGVLIVGFNDATSPYSYSGSAPDIGAFEYGSGPPTDTTPPTVSITAPTNGATVSGTTVTVSANASDNVGVTKVEFYYDSTNLIGTDNTSPYSIPWNTTTVSNGSHSLLAKAYDAANNVGTSSTISVTVNNTAGKIGDLNGDNQVNIFDLSILLTRWGSSDTTADLNHNGTVDIFDLSILLTHWGT